MSQSTPLNITLVGAGTIGLSFAALHLDHASRPGSDQLHLTIYDTRPDLESYVTKILPTYIPFSFKRLPGRSPTTYSVYINHDGSPHTISFNDDLKSAVSSASIVQEQGPESPSFKIAIWPEIESHCPSDALLWSSTSGIPASTQCANMKDPSRLVVVHPYNPPHIMPLLEIVPSPVTDPRVINRTLEFWQDKGRTPVLLKKETTGFIANRLAFALLREAIHLVKEGVASVEDIDDLMTSSMGPRWAVAGIFKSYHAGGGAGGLEGFFKNIGGTVQACWDDGGRVNVGEGWEDDVFRQTRQAYGEVDLTERDTLTRRVLEAVRRH